jgi:hypothetical protein
MHILVSSQHVRTAVVIAASATVLELKEKVAKQTAAPGKRPEYPADQQVLVLNGEVLCDEMTLAEHGVRDRDRIQLAKQQQDPPPQAFGGSGGNVGSSSLEAALTSLEKVAKDLDGYEVSIANRQSVHQELFTRLLESLDGIELEGLSEEERSLVRKQRKDLVRRTEDCSERARLVG